MVLCGPNNYGKTQLTYTLYGIYDSNLKFYFNTEDKKFLKENRKIELSIEQIKDRIQKSLPLQIEKFLENTEQLGYIGIVYLIFVFTMFFKDYEYIVNKIHGVNARPIYTSFFLYLSLLIVIPALIFVFIFLSTFSELSFFITLFTSLFIWLVFIILFMVSANRKISIRAAALSSLSNPTR